MNKFFLRVTGSLLIVTAVAKFWSATNGSATAANITDPLFGISFGVLFLLAGLVESCVGAMCILKPTEHSLGAVAWLSLFLIAYRIGLWWIGWEKPCSCLGNLTDALNISPELADNVMKGLLAFMFVGSVSLLFLHWRESRSSPEIAGGNAVTSSADERVSSV